LKCVHYEKEFPIPRKARPNKMKISSQGKQDENKTARLNKAAFHREADCLAILLSLN